MERTEEIQKTEGDMREKGILK